MNAKDTQSMIGSVPDEGSGAGGSSEGSMEWAESAARAKERYSQPKLVYFGPCLVSHGSLAQVTQFGGSTMVDSGSNLGDIP